MQKYTSRLICATQIWCKSKKVTNGRQHTTHVIVISNTLGWSLTSEMHLLSFNIWWTMFFLSYLDDFMVCYIDDILISPRTWRNIYDMYISFYTLNDEKPHLENRIKYNFKKCFYLHKMSNLTKWATCRLNIDLKNKST